MYIRAIYSYNKLGPDSLPFFILLAHSEFCMPLSLTELCMDYINPDDSNSRFNSGQKWATYSLADICIKKTGL